MITSQTLSSTGGGGYGPACGGKHYEIYSGTKPVSADGWTYSRCTSCGQRWRTKSVTEYLDADTQGTDLQSLDSEANSRQPDSPKQKTMSKPDIVFILLNILKVSKTEKAPQTLMTYIQGYIDRLENKPEYTYPVGPTQEEINNA